MGLQHIDSTGLLEEKVEDNENVLYLWPGGIVSSALPFKYPFAFEL